MATETFFTVGVHSPCMESEHDIADLPLPQRVVLLSLAHCLETGDGPVHTGEVIQACRSNVDHLGGDALGSMGEAEVSRALNQLEAAGLVSLEQRETSPTGKGRPVYSLAVETETVVEACRPDTQLEALLEAYQQAWS